MALSNITALVNSWTTPDMVVKGLDVTGWWADVTIYAIPVVILISTGDRYQRLSHRLAVSMFLTSILAIMFYSVDWLKTATLYRVLVGFVLSIAYLYADKSPQDVLE